MFKKKPKATPAQQEKVSKVMREGYSGDLHSGSKEGPIVKKRSQMQAIAMSEAGLSNKEHGRREGAGAVNKLEIYPGTTPAAPGSDGIEGLLKDSHGPTKAETSKKYGSMEETHIWDRGQRSHANHEFKPALGTTSGFGHSVAQRSSGLRLSGHSGAHRLGARSK